MSNAWIRSARRRSPGPPSCRRRAVVFFLVAEEVAPIGLPDTLRVQDHDGHFRLVGEPDGGAERVDRRHASAHPIFNGAATARACRKHNHAGVAITIPRQRQCDRVGLRLIDLFKSVACHSESLRASDPHTTKQGRVATCLLIRKVLIALRYDGSRAAPCYAELLSLAACGRGLQ